MFRQFGIGVEHGRTNTMNAYQKLGDLLVAEGAITNLQLSAVLTAQKTSRRRLGDLLVERGLVTEAQIVECLAKQYGYSVADLPEVQIEQAALELLDPEVALSYCVLPVKVDDFQFHCIISDPVDIVSGPTTSSKPWPAGSALIGP